MTLAERALCLSALPQPGVARSAAAAVPPRVLPAPCVRPAGVASPRCRDSRPLVLLTLAWRRRNA